MWIAMIHGFILAFGLILPLGMQNGFILTQGALQKQWNRTLPTVITAGFCDTFLILLAVIGVSATAFHILWIRYTIGIIGIVFLVYLGFTTWRKRDESSSPTITTAWTVKRQISFTLSVSLLNPHAWLDTLAVIGGSALAYSHWTERLMFGLACVMVSWIWFFGLSVTGHILGQVALKKASFHVLNQVSAVMMWASGIYLAYIIFRFH